MIVLSYLVGLAEAAKEPEKLINSAVIVQIIIGAVTLAGAVLVYRAATGANAVNRRKVDLDQYTAQQARYQSDIDAQRDRYKEMLAESDRDRARLKETIADLSALADRMTEQLKSEQKMSDVWREQVRDLRRQIDRLELELASMRVPARTTEPATQNPR